MPGYFATFGAGLVQGRDFTWSDDERAPRVALVSRRFAERHFAGESPLGQRLRLEADSAGCSGPRSSAWCLISAVNDTRDGAVNDRVYFPLMQTGDLHLAFALRTSADPLGER